MQRWIIIFQCFATFLWGLSTHTIYGATGVNLNTKKTLVQQLKLSRALEAAELHEKYLRLSQLQFQLKSLRNTAFFHDNDPVEPLSNLYVAFDADNFWSHWSRVPELVKILRARNSALLNQENRALNETEIQSSVLGLQIAGVGRPYTAKDLTVWALQNVGSKNGFICTEVSLKGSRIPTSLGIKEISSAGVAFNYNSLNGDYWVAMINNGDDTVTLKRLDNKGSIYETHSSKILGGIILWRKYNLGIQFTDNHIEVFVNGRRELALNTGIGPKNYGQLGLTIGQGKASFYNLNCGALTSLFRAPDYCFT